MASVGPFGEFHNGCFELEYVIPTTESIGSEYSSLPFLSLSVTVTRPLATSTVASRSRRLSPSDTTAWASKRKAVVTTGARAVAAGVGSGAGAAAAGVGDDLRGALGAAAAPG